MRDLKNVLEKQNCVDPLPDSDSKKALLIRVKFLIKKVVFYCRTDGDRPRDFEFALIKHCESM